MATKTIPKARRLDVKAREATVNIPMTHSDRYTALMSLTTDSLKALLRAEGIGIPKTKKDMANRLAHPGVTISVTVEAISFKS